MPNNCPAYHSSKNPGSLSKDTLKKIVLILV